MTTEKTNPTGTKKKTKKTIMKEMTTSLSELMDLPVEVLAKIFNFLSNHDIRCGVSLACTKFHGICQDKSLVPVKDLCIYGDEKRFFSSWESEFEAVSDIISQSKNLTSLKIKALNMDMANNLVSKALQACPKLIHLEIAETLEMTKGK